MVCFLQANTWQCWIFWQKVPAAEDAATNGPTEEPPLQARNFSHPVQFQLSLVEAESLSRAVYPMEL